MRHLMKLLSTLIYAPLAVLAAPLVLALWLADSEDRAPVLAHDHYQLGREALALAAAN